MNDPAKVWGVADELVLALQATLAELAAYQDISEDLALRVLAGMPNDANQARRRAQEMRHQAALVTGWNDTERHRRGRLARGEAIGRYREVGGRL